MRFEVSDDRCVACLACVRICPVDAVAVDGDAVGIVDESCIRCGVCVPACPHDAIEALGEFERALELARSGNALLVLSVEAEVHFYPYTPEQLVNACSKAGFRAVHRGVLGDELVSKEYEDLLEDPGWGTMIRSTCPVLVSAIRARYPELVPYLAPVKDPLAAEVTYLRERYGAEVPVVYTGVCLTEATDQVQAAITFEELGQLLEERGVEIGAQPTHHQRIPEERRRHRSTPGGLPLPVLERESQSSRRFRKFRGLKHLDVINRAVTKDGIELGFVDILPCEGCLDHPLLGPPDELFWRRSIMAQAEPARSSLPVVDPELELDLAREFQVSPNGARIPDEKLEEVVDEIGTGPGGRPWDCGACGYQTCRAFAAAYLRGRATLRQCPPYQERRAHDAVEQTGIDELTGLANFRALRRRLTEEVARSDRTSDPFAILFADLDGFKGINDRFGHEAGNVLLTKVAERISGLVRAGDIAARYGGDEFVVVLMGTTTGGAVRVAHSVRKAVLEAAAELGYDQGMLSVSIGVASHDPGRVSDTDVLNDADKGLYAAKAAGGNAVAVVGNEGEMNLY